MFRWGRASVAYAVIAMAALAVGRAFDLGWLISYRSPWLPLAGVEAHAFGLVLGVTFAAAVVVGTRVLVENAAWARNLHRDLRPLTLHLDATGIAVIAVLSAVGEELVFRGLLMPWLGVLPQALLFGVMHAQLSGPSRWVWAAWATVVGLALGAIFALSGSLLGAIAAHALINGINLAFLKSHDTAPPRHSLGGLLSDRRSPVPERHPPLPERRPSPVPAGRRA
jgi:membrane protease YdiL (CAAX protease family)